MAARNNHKSITLPDSYWSHESESEHACRILPIHAQSRQTWHDIIPVVPARGGAEVALGIYIYIYKTFLIYRTCMRRAPAKPVHACILRQLCPVSHVTFEAPLRTSHFSLHSSHSTLHTQHSTLHTPHFTLLTALFALHTSLRTALLRLHTSHSTLHSPHFTLLTSHCFIHTSHSTLHTALFTPHTSHCTFHTPHFISSELFSPFPSSCLLISSLLICHLSFHESLPSTTTKELACVVRQPGPCVRALCEAVAVLLSKNMTCEQPRCNATPSKHFPHTSHCALHTSHLHFTLALHLNSSHLGSSHLIPCLAQNTFQYYSVLQSLQSTSQYYCVLQSLHKLLPSTDV